MVSRFSIREWIAAGNADNVIAIVKDAADTQAWWATVNGQSSFLKFFPGSLVETRAAIGAQIAGANLHPAIVPLRQAVSLADGLLLVYDRVNGETLDSMEIRKRFQFLPIAERVTACLAIFNTLGAICEAGFMVVDWYEGNMIYDFDRKKAWLFDWELCRRGSGFTLEMDNNYGSSRLMAPEEFVRGSLLDQRTFVFNLGRFALLYLPEYADLLAPTVARATYPARAERFPTVREFTQSFLLALNEQSPAP